MQLVATPYTKYCSASPPHGLHQICQFLLWDVTPLFPQGTCKFPDISGGNGPSPHPPISGIKIIRALRWPWQNIDIPVLQEITYRTSSMAGGIVMLEGHVRMNLQEGYHMREEDVFPVTHSVEIACNDNKLSPMMLWHIAPYLDGPSTSKSIPLQSTGLGVTLFPSTINANPTITPGEAEPRLVSEEHFLPVLSGPATIGNSVACDVWWGHALQQAYKPSVQPLSAYLRTVWAVKLFEFLRIIFERQGPEKGDVSFFLLSLCWYHTEEAHSNSNSLETVRFPLFTFLSLAVFLSLSLSLCLFLSLLFVLFWTVVYSGEPIETRVSFAMVPWGQQYNTFKMINTNEINYKLQNQHCSFKRHKYNYLHEIQTVSIIIRFIQH